MKKIAGFLLAIVVLAACNTKSNQEASEEVSSQETTTVEVEAADGFYGEKIEESGTVLMADFISKMEVNDSMSVKVRGTIEETCKMKGCWMTVQTAEGETMRVTFKDYGFFVPKEGMAGKEVIIEGTAKKKVVSKENLKHYAQDAGASKEEIDAITNDEEQITFEATGVIIKEAGV